MIDRRAKAHPAASRLATPGWAVLAGLILASTAALGGEPPRPLGAAFLEKAWPDHPEWLAMLADILVVGDRIGGDDGWFRKAVSRTRFGWEATRDRLDRDGDGTISRPEFPGSDADFGRLDRDRDGTLSPADFDFRPQPATPGSQLFARTDRDGNGKVTREEFEALFRAMDGGNLGFLSMADVQSSLSPPPGPKPGPGEGPRGPDRSTFLKSFLRGELGAFPSGPGLGDDAPDFTLKTVEGDREIALSKVVGPGPVVLVFGNFTCSPFRAQGGNLEKLHRRYRDRATFLMVYVREAHPTDGWRMETNDRAGVAFSQPRTDEERRSVAQACQKSLGLGFPMLVDTVEDAVNDRYSGIPSRLYLIDRRGKVAFKGGRGPFGFKPAELEQSLILLLNPTPTRPPGPDRDPSEPE